MSASPDELLDDATAQARFDTPTASDLSVISLLRALPPLTMPDTVSGAMLESIAGVSGLSSSPESQKTDAAVVDLSQARDSRRTRRPGWVAPVAVAAAAACVVGVAATVMRPASSGAPGTTISGQVGPVIASGLDYSADGLAAAATQLARKTGATGEDTSRFAPLDAEAVAGTFAATPASLASCVSGIGNAPAVSVLAVDLASFQGQPAGVLITRAGASAPLEAIVVPLTCSAESPQVLARAELATP